jgi:hypothetical protein
MQPDRRTAGAPRCGRAPESDPATTVRLGHQDVDADGGGVMPVDAVDESAEGRAVATDQGR